MEFAAAQTLAAVFKICYNFAPAIIIPFAVMAVLSILDRQ